MTSYAMFLHSLCDSPAIDGEWILNYCTLFSAWKCALTIVGPCPTVQHGCSSPSLGTAGQILLRLIHARILSINHASSLTEVRLAIEKMMCTEPNYAIVFYS
uniref:Uncharacterized protein n=1 Tax=Rhipicephalus appendiculatus TaxID=34631 RepID=A0A131YAN1_RHIAP